MERYEALNKTSVVLPACCVCGAETTLRCSACEAAGIKLSFCSREHQKLIWKNGHAKVCGSKAHPFLYPDLSSDEADELRRLAQPGALRKPTAGRAEETGAHGLKCGLQLRRPPRSSIRRRLCGLVGVPEKDFERRHRLLSTARSMVYDAVDDGYEYSGTTLHLGPFYPVAQLETYFATTYPSFHNSKEESQLLHRALVLFHLLHLRHQVPPPPSFDDAFPLHALRALGLACFDVLPFESTAHTQSTIRTVSRLVKPRLLYEAAWMTHEPTLTLMDMFVTPLEKQEVESDSEQESDA
ncbi:hypothetical protein JCM8097_007950 [Rhodosporidiobolus ruineniae]